MPTRGEPEDSVELSARLPTRSLSGATEESTDALRLIMYLEEVREQALIGNRAFARAWRAALTPDYDNDAVWADLQAMLFAGVVIQRILLPDPSSIRPKAGRSREECRAWAHERGRQLRELLDIDEEDQRAFEVALVRNPLEHIDERLDELVLGGFSTVSDRYVSYGTLAAGLPGDAGRSPTASFRVFIPNGGLLIFGDKRLDVFQLDHAMLTLRHESVPAAVAELEKSITGRSLFGGQRLVDYADEERWKRRREVFLRGRAERGDPIT